MAELDLLPGAQCVSVAQSLQPLGQVHRLGGVCPVELLEYGQTSAVVCWHAHHVLQELCSSLGWQGYNPYSLGLLAHGGCIYSAVFVQNLCQKKKKR